MRTLVAFTSRAAALLSLALLIAWATGRILTDRWLWSQYLYWMPSILVLPAALAGVIASWLLPLPVRPSSPIGGGVPTSRDGGGSGARASSTSSTPRLPASLLRRLSVVLFLLCSLYSFLFEWNYIRAFSGSPGAQSPSLRILYWNASDARPETISAPVAAQSPDIAVIVNAHSGTPLADLASSFGPGFGFVNASQMCITTRGLPVLRWSQIWLGLPPAPEPGDNEPAAPGSSRPAPPSRHSDPGRAMFVEIDTTKTLGRTTVVWIIDLPSDRRLHRAQVTADAASAIRDWTGWAYRPDPEGKLPAQQEKLTGFPPPDIIVGDFNIPRSSASLTALTGGLESAFTQSGRGPSATYPRRLPLWHIDQMFLRAPLNAASYRVLDPGTGEHRMQVGELRQ